VAAVAMNDLLDGHVLRDVQCLDPIYLNGHVPNLHVGGHLADTSRLVMLPSAVEQPTTRA
jgi:hypothetical protein